jgi:hypothetical protein
VGRPGGSVSNGPQKNQNQSARDDDTDGKIEKNNCVDSLLFCVWGCLSITLWRNITDFEPEFKIRIGSIPFFGRVTHPVRYHPPDAARRIGGVSVPSRD